MMTNSQTEMFNDGRMMMDTAATASTSRMTTIRVDKPGRFVVDRFGHARRCRPSRG